MSTKLILFSLALNASLADVNEVIDTIKRTFGIEADEQGVAPSLALAAQNGNQGVAQTGTDAERDANGDIWDARIHSSSKAKTVKGIWRARKGLDESTLAGVKAQIGLTVAAPTLPSLPSAPAPLPAIETPYTKFVAFVVSHTKSDENPAGRLTSEWVKASLAHYGIAEGSLQNLAHRPEMVEPIQDAFKTALGL